jgi:hypothetical protein
VLVPSVALWRDGGFTTGTEAQAALGTLKGVEAATMRTKSAHWRTDGEFGFTALKQIIGRRFDDVVVQEFVQNRLTPLGIEVRMPPMLPHGADDAVRVGPQRAARHGPVESVS